MAGARTNDGLVFGRVGVFGFDGQDALPVFPILVFDDESDGRADGLGVADARNNTGLICFNLHTTAAAEALLTTPELPIQIFDGYGHAGGQAGECGYKALAMGFSSGFKTKHESTFIVAIE